MQTKTCTKCVISKAIDLFPAKKNKCKDCVAEYMKEYFQKRKFELMAAHKEWVLKNPKKNLEHQQKYSQKNKEIYAESARKWRAKNPEVVKKQKKRWEKSNRTAAGVSYCKKILACQLGVSWAEIPQNLIAMKREQIFNQRLTKQLTSLIKEKSNGS